MAFLYPRRYNLSERHGHFHQGVDLGRGGQAVVAVTAGTVVLARDRPQDPGPGGYGRVIIVRGENDFYYLYGHLASITPSLLQPGARVQERMQIGTVGNTLWNRWPNRAQRDRIQEQVREQRGDDFYILTDEDLVAIFNRSSMAAHLHFQVNTASQATPAGDRERTPWDESTRGNAVDPLEHLEQLGPWGSGTRITSSTSQGDFTDVDRRFYCPDGRPIDPSSIESRFLRIEQNPQGGYFPLSSGNLWHGGVHLPVGALGTRVHAPLPGKIVAFRFDEDESRAYREHGSTNFILLRHEMSPEIAHQLRPPPASTTSPAAEQPAAAATPPARPRRVGRSLGAPRGRINPPDMVRQIKARLRALTRPDGAAPYYSPTNAAELTSGEVTQALHQAIVDYQRDVFGRNWRGIVDEGGTTWRRLMGIPDPPEQEEEPPPAAAPPTDAPIHFYTLLMHLSAARLDDEVARVPWLARARHAARNDAERDEDAQAEAEDREDRAEAALISRLSNTVGPTSPPPTPPRRATTTRDRNGWNQRDDIVWVQRRLKRFGYLSFDGEPSGVFDAALEEAIRRFQTAHVAYFRTRTADGEVGPSGSTFRALATAARDLGLRAGHPRLFRLLRETATSGTTAVVTGLQPGTDEVVGGEVLWGAGPSGNAGTGEVHWEMFSAAQLMGGPDWWSVEDRDDGLTFDSAAVLARAIDAPASAAGLDSVMLSADDVRAIYRRRESRALRVLQALFRSEWSQEASAYATLEPHGVDGASDLEAQIAPYLWWRAAAGVLPDSHHVWHYHPIQFLLAYGTHTDAFVGVVVITAHDETGMPEQGWAIIEGLDGQYETILEPFGSTGAVVRVPPGPARVRIELFDEREVESRQLNVTVGGVHRASFQTVRNAGAIMSRAAGS